MVKWIWLLPALLMAACASTSEPETGEVDLVVPVEEAEPAEASQETDLEESMADPFEDPAEEPAPEIEPPALPDKTELVKRMENRMRFFLGDSVESFESIHLRCAKEIDALTPPPKIQAVEHELLDFYHEVEENYEAKVQEIVDRYEEELKNSLIEKDPAIWDIALEIAGTEDAGLGYGSRTGIDDVDDCAEATINLINFRAGMDELLDDGRYAKQRRILLDRFFKHDIEDQGRFSIYSSDFLPHHFRKNEDIVAVTITYQKKGLDPATPIEFRQIVRNRIVRGGTDRFKSEFHWDETLGTREGRLLLVERGDQSVIIVSQVFYPRVNMDHPYFDRLKDYTAIRDYKTAVVNADTGEVLDCASWQYKWNISHYGSVSVEKGASPSEDADAVILKQMLRK
jgi:hypothetical protein